MFTLKGSIIKNSLNLFRSQVSKKAFTTGQKVINRSLVGSPHFTGYQSFLIVSVGVVFGLSTASVLSSDSNKIFLSESPLKNEQQSVEVTDSVIVDKGVGPFPLTLKDDQLNTTYELLGYGSRYVTFIKFKVYACGVYIAKDDKALVPMVLDSKYLTALINSNTSQSESDSLTHEEKLRRALLDPQLGSVLMGNLLDSGARILIRIVPVRNTDFNHLRDGFVRSTLAHPASKTKDPKESEIIAVGLDGLRSAFGSVKGSVPKGHILSLERLGDGRLDFIYYDSKSEGNKKKASRLGSVDINPVTKILFLHYLSGSNPASSDTRDRVVDGLVKLSV